MSARDAFFKKMEDNQTAEQAGAESLKTTIGEFQSETNQILAIIQEWFKGTSVRAEITKQTLVAESTNVPYPIGTLRLINGSKALEIVPEGLFFVGTTGSLKVALRTTSSRRELFYLHMKDSRANHGGWSIVHGPAPVKVIPFNQDNFFENIGDFA